MGAWFGRSEGRESVDSLTPALRDPLRSVSLHASVNRTVKGGTVRSCVLMKRPRLGKRYSE